VLPIWLEELSNIKLKENIFFERPIDKSENVEALFELACAWTVLESAELPTTPQALYLALLNI
jgi:hypothetical protein